MLVDVRAPPNCTPLLHVLGHACAVPEELARNHGHSARPQVDDAAFHATIIHMMKNIYSCCCVMMQTDAVCFVHEDH